MGFIIGGDKKEVYFTNVLEKGYGRLTFLDKQNDLKTANSIVVV